MALLPVVALLVWWAARRRRQVLSDWGEASVAMGLFSARRRLVRNLLWVVAFAGLVIGLAQPRGGSASRVLNRQGSDVVFVLDVSKSMLARDVSPDRLQRGIFEIERLLEGLKSDRVGLVVFAGTSFMQAPLTVDFAVVRNTLHHLDPNEMPYPGSNIGLGLDRGIELVKASPGGSRAVVLLTDGEETAGDAAEIARKAGEQKIPIFVLALGTQRGEPIPALSAEGRTEILRDSEGKAVFSKLDERGLQNIAELSGGRYFRLGAGGESNAVGKVLGQLEKKTLDERTVTERAELYGLVVGPALFLFMVGLWINERASL
ncbi:MAG: VWA domain-containing protein [Burkholderiales bacterium]|nr:VWA domain-containing protein [Burkholderiales bacterium]